MPMFLKHDNKYYQELNYKMMQWYLTHELKQFIYDLAFQETERLYVILQTKYADQFKARKFMKEWKTPDYLLLNNPTNEVRDPIRRDGMAIIKDANVDDETLKSIIDDLLQLPVNTPAPSVVLPKSSGNELEDLRKIIAEMQKKLDQKEDRNLPPNVQVNTIPLTQPEAKPTISAVDTVQTSTSSEKIEFTNPVNPRVAEAAVAAVEADVEAWINTIVEEIIDTPLTTDDEWSIQ